MSSSTAENIGRWGLRAFVIMAFVATALAASKEFPGWFGIACALAWCFWLGVVMYRWASGRGV